MADYTVVNGSSTVLGASDVAYINGFASKFKVAYSDGVITLTNKSTKAVYEFSAAAGAKLAFLNGAVTVGADGKVSLKKAAINPAITSVESFVTVAPAAFTLTEGVNTVVGTAKSEIIEANTITNVNNGAAANNATFTALDSIDGGAGRDTLRITSIGNYTDPAGATVTAVEVATIRSSGSVTTDTSAWTGLETLTTTGVGLANVTAAGTTDITANSSTVAATEITANGGKDVTLNLTGFSANAAGPAGGVAVGGATAATGNVVVNVTGIAGNVAGTTLTATGIAVTGGDTITVNQLNANAVNTTVTHSEVAIQGDAQTTAVTVANSAAATAAAAVVGVSVGGGITVTDVAEAAGTADHISTVTLRNFGATTITSSALSTLNVTGGSTAALASGGLTLTAQSATTPATTLTLNSAGGFMGAIAGTQAGAYTTVNVNSSAATTIANLTSAGLQTLNFTGSGNTTLTASTLGAATVDINVTGTGGVTLGTAIGAGVDFDGNSGADSIIITGATTQGITMGDGNDTVAITAGTIAGAGLGVAGSVAGGNGTDVLVMAEADADAADANAAFNADFTSFETLRLADGAADGINTRALDIDALNDVTRVELTGTTVAYDGTLTLNNINTGATLMLDTAALADNAGDGGDGVNTASVVVTIDGAVARNTDTLNVILNNAAAAGVQFDDVTAALVETVNITTVDTGTVAAARTAATTDALVLAATAATSIVVSGNNGLTLTNVGNVAVTNFNASGVVGDAAEDTGALLAVTFASANTTANAAVTITGGAGDDVLTGSAAAVNLDTISGGAGDDDITGGTGVDTLTGGADRDAFIFGAAHSAAATADSITDFTMASAVTAGTVGAWSGGNGGETANEFQAATFGGANTDILDLAVTTIRANAAGAAGQAANVTFSVASGILTLGGAGASTVDTLGEWIAEADAAAGNANVAFQFGGDTYVYEGTNNQMVKLVGVTGAAALAVAAENTAIVANTILVI